MAKKSYMQVLFFTAVIMLALLSACQKDSAAATPASSRSNADSSIVSMSGNFLAASGTLKVKFKDSVYTFDAARDSIAFINVGNGTEPRYFGITAINKDHTNSFGISSEGFAASNVNRAVAGGQFLLSAGNGKPAIELSLHNTSSPVNFGNFSLEEYQSGNELARGTFYTFLSGDDQSKVPFYKVEGSFDLKLK